MGSKSMLFASVLSFVRDVKPNYRLYYSINTHCTGYAMVLLQTLEAVQSKVAFDALLVQTN